VPAGQQQGSRTLERAPRGQSAPLSSSRSICNQVRQFAGSAAGTVLVRFRSMRSGLGAELALARGALAAEMREIWRYFDLDDAALPAKCADIEAYG